MNVFVLFPFEIKPLYEKTILEGDRLCVWLILQYQFDDKVKTDFFFFSFVNTLVLCLFKVY